MASGSLWARGSRERTAGDRAAVGGGSRPAPRSGAIKDSAAHAGRNYPAGVMATRTTRPPVVVFTAVRNEERDLRRALDAVLAQDYPGPIVVSVAVGPSSDRTAEIASGAARDDSRVVVSPNPSGLTPQGLNIAVREGIRALPTATYLVRTDGHAELPPNYLRTAVDVLERTGADNVGGMMVPVGATPFQEAVAAAMTHPVGLGGGRFHVGGQEGVADTVYLGAFRRSTFERAGGYDEHWSRAQDWELNHRLREAGGVVWFTPTLRVEYRPRSALKPLVVQFYRTGRWRREVIRRYPQTASPRYLAPPSALVAVTAGAALGAVGLAAGTAAAWALALPIGYFIGVVAGAGLASVGLPWRVRVRLPVVLLVMHMAWGAGFVFGGSLARDAGSTRRAG